MRGGNESPPIDSDEPAFIAGEPADYPRVRRLTSGEKRSNLRFDLCPQRRLVQHAFRVLPGDDSSVMSGTHFWFRDEKLGIEFRAKRFDGKSTLTPIQPVLKYPLSFVHFDLFSIGGFADLSAVRCLKNDRISWLCNKILQLFMGTNPIAHKRLMSNDLQGKKFFHKNRDEN